MSADLTAVERLTTALAAAKLPIFAARFDLNGSRILTLCTMDGSAAAIRQSGRALLKDLGIEAQVVVLRRSAGSLRRARSYESLLRLTGRGELVADGTLALRRAELIVELGREIRHALPDTAGLLFEPERRSLFVVVPPQAITAVGEAGVLEQVRAAWTGWFADEAEALNLSIRVTATPPLGSALAVVDNGTGRSLLRRILSIRRLGKLVHVTLAMLTGTATTVPVLADAVVIPNFSTAVHGGVQKGDTGIVEIGKLKGLGRLSAKYALPLGKDFGLQIDGAAGTDQYYGAGAHLFQRNSMGRIGAVGSLETDSATRMFRFGAEGELYANAVTLFGAAGLQAGDVTEGVWGKLDLSYYATPDLSLTVGVETQPDLNLVHAGFEWLPALDTLPELSVFGDVGITSIESYRVLFGVNFQIDAKAPLIDRDRKYNVKSALFSPIKHRPTGYAGR
jgi:hypothetical protein